MVIKLTLVKFLIMYIVYVIKAFVLHIIIINKFLDGSVLCNTPLYLKVFRFFTGIIFMVIML